MEIKGNNQICPINCGSTVCTHSYDWKINLYTQATNIARQLNQTVGMKRNYYITLEQLESLLKKL